MLASDSDFYSANSLKLTFLVSTGTAMSEEVIENSCVCVCVKVL